MPEPQGLSMSRLLSREREELVKVLTGGHRELGINRNKEDRVKTIIMIEVLVSEEIIFVYIVFCCIRS